MVEHVMREVNGYDLSTGKLLNGIGENGHLSELRLDLAG